MKTTEQIIEEARASYERHFKDAQARMTPKSDDVVLDKEKLTEEVKDLEIKEEKKHNSLEVLREQVVHEAEVSFHKIFKDAKEAKPTPQMSVDEMYKTLEEEKVRLSQMVEKLKEKQMSK
ncbi:hypothetical protein [Candidatus Stoquefichus massiliensis]|uniref:hypothetical protein n=1 Tax=Candidatus Stoquefichus massiliensis TaxID=1470350 RepID=UPI0004897048|nr:hypothetical protein [Candidatus Stoquefichus massiliensis]